jgi:hypothetical protein
MGWMVNTMPGLLYPSGKTWYPLYRRLGGPQGWSGRVQKISIPIGIDPRIVQPIAAVPTTPMYTIYIHVIAKITIRSLASMHRFNFHVPQGNLALE